jgi:peptidoglycan/xylan/chitin deacetylase (PgdA/CDA1 family)
MFRHQNVRIAFLLLFIAIAVADFWYSIPVVTYLLVPVVFLTVTLIGSYFIQWNYFFNSINNGDRSGNKIAITFDDAPLEPYTNQVLDLLKQHNIKALFFLIGKQIKGNEAIVLRIVNEGHIIGNHSFSHVNSFPIFSVSKMIADTQQCDAEIERVTGKRVRLFRPPFGVTNPRVGATVKQQEYLSIGWSLRSYDTTITNRNKLMQRCLVSLRAGDVVLFHDWGKHTLDILPEWIEEVKKRGLKIVRADELLGIEAYR